MEGLTDTERLMLAEIAPIAANPDRSLLPAQAPLINIFASAPDMCAVCSAPVYGYTYCRPCSIHRSKLDWAAADRVIPLTYALDGQQMWHDMFRYKDNPATQNPSLARVIYLVYFARRFHWQCIESLSAVPITAAVVVPSTKGRVNHPLGELLKFLWAGDVCDVRCVTPSQPRTRELHTEDFSVHGDVSGRHVVLLEDAWVTGANAQSVAASLKHAGAVEVTVLVVARMLRGSFEPTQRFLQAGCLPAGYNIDVCPATQGTCPVR